MTHICVSEPTSTGSDNGLSPGRRQANFWTNAGINFSEIVIEIQLFSLRKMRLKLSSAKRQPFCLGHNVLNVRWWRGLDPSSSTIVLTGPQWWIVTRASHGTGCDYHMSVALQWRHNERDCVSNHHPRDCLLNRLSRRRSKKTSKVHVTGLYMVNSPVTGEFPAQRASNAENVSIWWRHHGPAKSVVCHKENGQFQVWYQSHLWCATMKYTRENIFSFYLWHISDQPLNIGSVNYLVSYMS